MFGIPPWLWLLAAFVAAGVLAWFTLDFAQRAAKLRKRRAYYARAGNQTGPMQLSSRPAPLSPGLSPAQSAFIRAHAERSAQDAWNAGAAGVRNPYAEGTTEFVLWYASYQLRMGELAEQADAEARHEQQHGDAERPGGVQ